MIDEEQQTTISTEDDQRPAEWSEEVTVEDEQPRPLAFSPVYSRNLLPAQMALLDNEVVSLHTNPEAYRIVKTQYAALERWHEKHTGWRIQRGSTFFRLERHLHAVTPVFTDEKLKKARDFACLTWLLWFAEKRHLAGGGRNQQFLLSQLAEEIQEQSAITAVTTGKQLDFRNQHDRYSMWRALDYLTRLGGVQTLEGETRKWVEDAPDNEVLYEFTPIAHSLVEALLERQVAALATRMYDPMHRLQPYYLPALSDPIPPLSRAWRTLLLGPALFRYDDPVAFDALIKNAAAVSDDLSEAFGWLLELNNDYACIVRGGTLSTGSGPTLTLASANDQMILLLCSAFRQRVEAGEWSPDSYGCVRVSQSDVAPIFTELRQRFGMHWGSTAQAAKATDLLDELYQKMRLLGLVRGPDAVGDLLILPTAARYSVTYTTEPAETRSRARTKAKTTTATKTVQPQLSLN